MAGCIGVHGRDAAVKSEFVCLLRKLAVGKHRLQIGVALQKACRRLRTYASRTGDLVRRVTLQGNEVGNLEWLAPARPSSGSPRSAAHRKALSVGCVCHGTEKNMKDA